MKRTCVAVLLAFAVIPLVTLGRPGIEMPNADCWDIQEQMLEAQRMNARIAENEEEQADAFEFGIVANQQSAGWVIEQQHGGNWRGGTAAWARKLERDLRKLGRMRRRIDRLRRGIVTLEIYELPNAELSRPRENVPPQSVPTLPGQVEDPDQGY